jgi:exodeoxyribonuclease-3
LAFSAARSYSARVKLATWNVNSIRARLDRVLEWIDGAKPDVVCMQEIKCLDTEFPALEFQTRGYKVATHGQKTYNGVALLARAELTDVTRGFGDGGDDAQSRCIAATVGDLRVVSVYVPNGQAVGSDKFAYKLEWLARLKTYVAKELAAHAQLVVGGDYNVAPEPIDVHDPAAWEGQVLFTKEERAALAAVESVGVKDVLRALRPAEQVFTWWDYRMLAFPKNRGLRIDLLLASPAALERAQSCVVDRDARKGKQPSDHAPVIVELAD